MHAKGNFGIPLILYGVGAYALVLFGQTIPLIILSLFVVLAEKDNQTSLIVLEALALQFTANLAFLALSLIIMIGGIIPFIGLLIAGVTGIAGLVISVMAGGVAILGIIKAAKDEALNFPLLANFANSMLMFINRF